MKKIGFLLLSFLLSAQIYAQTTKTTTTFNDVAYNNTPVDGVENEYGETELYKEATISTQNFKVDNFWDKFSDSKNGTSTYTQVSKIGTFKLTVKSSFACAKSGLAQEGCSGQKPFLLNTGVLNNPDMKKTSIGDALPTDEYRIPFDDSVNYTISNDDAFYAMDVDRIESYYKEPEVHPPAGKESFFSNMIKMFTSHFSKDVNVYGDILTPDEAAIRARYIANIVYGHDKDNRLKIASASSSATLIDTVVPAANNPVSLLNYEELLTTETAGCDGFILNFSSNSLTCRFMTGFGMGNYMPFFNTDATYDVEAKSVMSDTESTLLTLAGELNDKNYILDAKKDSNGNFLSEIFKPMTFMFSSMGRFWFGSGTPKTVEAVVAEFNFDNYLPLTFAVTNGTEIVGFKHFNLMGIESVYGTEVESCTVRESGIIPFFSKSTTYYAGIATNTKFDMEDGFFGSIFNDANDYDQLVVTEERHWGRDHDIVNVSTDDWLNWCKRNQAERGKGIFGRFLDNLGSMLSNPTSYDSQLDKLLSDEHYSVKQYKEKVHRGLILHLKEEKISLGQSGTNTTYKLMNVK